MFVYWFPETFTHTAHWRCISEYRTEDCAHKTGSIGITEATLELPSFTTCYRRKQSCNTWLWPRDGAWVPTVRVDIRGKACGVQLVRVSLSVPRLAVPCPSCEASRNGPPCGKKGLGAHSRVSFAPTLPPLHAIEALGRPPPPACRPSGVR